MFEVNNKDAKGMTSFCSTILDKTLCNTKRSTFTSPFSPFSTNPMLQSSDSWFLSGKSSVLLCHSTLNEGIGGIAEALH